MIKAWLNTRDKAWTSRGIAGRGVLVDFASRAKRKGKTFNTFSQFAITLEEVKSIVEEEKLVFQPGDILFLRTDYVEAYRSATAEQKQDIARNRGWIGLGQGKETTEWLRENQFAAVADDNPGFDCRREYICQFQPGDQTLTVEQLPQTTFKPGTCTRYCLRAGELLLGSYSTWTGWLNCARSARSGLSSSRALP